MQSQEKLIVDKETINLYECLISNIDKNIQELLKQEALIFYTQVKEFKLYLNQFNTESENKLFSELINSVALTEKNIKLLIEELNQSFLLFIVGMGKFGKSTLINSLLGQHVAEMGVLPKTWKIDIFQKTQNDDKVEIVFENSKKQIYNIIDAKEFLAKEEKKVQTSEEKILQKFKENHHKYNLIEEKEEYKELLKHQFLYHSPVIEVIWPITENELSKHFRLVDTPGLFQERFGNLKISINEYYFKADGVIWLLDATKISAQKPFEMMKDLKLVLNEINGRTDNVIAVLNRIDIVKQKLTEEDYEIFLNKVHSIFAGLFKDIIPISAKDALKGILENNEQLIIKSGINDLKQYIFNQFLENAKIIQTQSKSLGLLQLRKSLIFDLSRYEKKLEEDILKVTKDFNTLLREVESLFKDIQLLYGNQIKKYTKEFEENFEKNINILFDSEINKSRKLNVIRNKIFNLNSLQESMGILIKDLNKKIIKMVEFHERQVVLREYKYICTFETDVYFSSTFKNQNFTFDTLDFNIDNIIGSAIGAGAWGAVLGSFVIPGIGTVLGGLLGSLIGGIKSAIINKDKKLKVRTELNKKLEIILKSYNENMDLMIDTNKKAIKKHLKFIQHNSFAELHFDFNKSEELIKAIKDRVYETQKTYNSPNYETFRFLLN